MVKLKMVGRIDEDEDFEDDVQDEDVEDETMRRPCGSLWILKLLISTERVDFFSFSLSPPFLGWDGMDVQSMYKPIHTQTLYNMTDT
jgi:hypothetical protein